MKQQSSKQALINRKRKILRRQLHDERGLYCEARKAKDCQNTWTDLHEILPRGAGGNPTDPKNIKLVCQHCHRWIHNNPIEAREAGLLRSRNHADNAKDPPKMNEERAARLMLQSYKDTAGRLPTELTIAKINMQAPHVAKGAKFYWDKSGITYKLRVESA